MSTVKTDVQDTSATRKTITVSISAADIAAIEANLIKDFQREAQIPGFRRGKAPENMIRMRYAKDLKVELSKRAVSKAHQDGVAKCDLDIFDIIEIDAGEIAADGNLTVTFTIDVLQDFELPNYEGLKLRNEPTAASAEEIDQMLNGLLSQRAEFNVAEKAADPGDYVQCAYEGKIGDQLIADLVPDAPMFGSQKLTWEEAGAQHAPGVRAIVEGIVGMSAGDEKEVTMEFPNDFKPEALAGKTAVYTLQVKEVREKILPPLDQALFDSLQVDDEAGLRERLRETIEHRKKQQNLDAERQQVTEQLLGSVEFEIPQSGVEQETNAILRDFMARNMRQGVAEADFEAHKEQLYEGANQAARKRFKSRLILSKIAEKEKLQAKTEDFSRMLAMEAEKSSQPLQKMLKQIQKDQSRINQMRIEILVYKAMDLILEKAERETTVSTTDD